MRYIVTDQPTVEPVTLAEAKAQVRELAGGLTEDGLISGYIVAARDYAESVQGRALMEQTIQEYYDGWECVHLLSRGEVSEVVKVECFLSGGTDYTVWADTNYYNDIISVPARVVKKAGSTFPILENRPNSVRITYKAGVSNATQIPGTTKQAMLLLIASFYENREDGETTLVTSDQRVQTADKLLRLNRLIV